MKSTDFGEVRTTLGPRETIGLPRQKTALPRSDHARTTLGPRSIFPKPSCCQFICILQITLMEVGCSTTSFVSGQTLSWTQPAPTLPVSVWWSRHTHGIPRGLNGKGLVGAMPSKFAQPKLMLGTSFPWLSDISQATRKSGFVSSPFDLIPQKLLDRVQIGMGPPLIRLLRLRSGEREMMDKSYKTMERSFGLKMGQARNLWNSTFLMQGTLFNRVFKSGSCGPTSPS